MFEAFFVSYIWAVKKRFAIFNAVFATALLFSMLFQSLHSFEHLTELLSEKQCHHKYASPHEITHQHHNFDHCFVCDFTFGSFIWPESFSYQLHFVKTGTPYLFSETGIIISDFRSTNPLRGPPSFIV